MSGSNSKIIKELRPIPLKKIEHCPTPTLLHSTDDYDYILLITDFFSDKKCLSYDVDREHYFEFSNYPGIRLIDPIYSASPCGKLLYIFDGSHQSFAMLDIEVDRNDACYHPKVVNIRKTKRKTEKLRNLIKTGKGCLSIYLPNPWNEYHIIGGVMNRQHLKWSLKQKQFVSVSETNSIQTHENGICATNIFFSAKFKQFILMGGGDNIYNLSYPSTEIKGLSWIKSLIKLPYQNMTQFGCAIYNQQYIITFGGVAKKNNPKLEKLEEIFILDIERNEWRKSKLKCPVPGIFHAIYVKKCKKIHLFARERDKNYAFRHWLIDLYPILANAAAYDREKELESQNKQNILDEQEIKNAEEIDFQKHVLYHAPKPSDGEKFGGIGKEVIGMKEEISLIWDFITKLKNDMQIIKEYQIEIINNSQQNSQRIIELHQQIKMLKQKKIKKKIKKEKKRKKLSDNYDNYDENKWYQEEEEEEGPEQEPQQYQAPKPKPKQTQQSLVINDKKNYDIFDTDEEDQFIEDGEVKNDSNNYAENVTVENIEKTKNLSLMAEDVDYDSIDIKDDEYDEKLKIKIKNQMKHEKNKNEKIKKINNVDLEMKGMALKEWLIKNRLSEYFGIFIEKGFYCMDQLIHLDDSAFLTQIGVTKLVHRRKLIAKLKIYSQSKK